MAKCSIGLSFVAISIFLASSALAVHLQGEEGLDQFGATVSELEDQNSDGRWELLVGGPFHDSTGTDDGRVYLWFGGTELTSEANLVLTGDQNEQFGYSVARIGDVNDDGHGDFAVGAPAYQSVPENGRVYIFFGGPGLDVTADVIIESPSTTSRFGHAVSAAGDFDGDGKDDLIVGAPLGDVNGANAGEAYLYYGRSSWPATVNSADVTLEGQVAGDHFGWSVSDADEFFRNGRDCVVVGAPLNSTHGGIDGGAAYVYIGGTPGFPPDTLADLEMGSSNNPAASEFGSAVRGLGDWNDDSTPDIAVGAPYHNDGGADAGRVEIFFGGTSPSNIAARDVDGETAGDRFGWSLADVGDVTGSNAADLLIGAPWRDESGSAAGHAYLYVGGSPDYSTAASLLDVPATGVVGGSLPDDHYGYAVSAAGDFDGDLQLDHAVGAENGNIASLAQAGYVHLLDSSGGVTPAFLQNWSAVWSADGVASLAFSFTEDPSAVARLIVVREVIPGGAGTTARTVIADGVPASGMSDLRIEAGIWYLTDRPGSLPANAFLAYTLTLLLHDGREIRLERLAGPPPLPASLRPELSPARPNPFNPRTSLTFRAPAGTQTVCRVMDLRGRLVATLFRGTATGAWQQVDWDGRTDAGRTAAAGLYLVQLRTAGGSTYQRIVLAK